MSVLVSNLVRLSPVGVDPASEGLIGPEGELHAAVLTAALRHWEGVGAIGRSHTSVILKNGPNFSK